MDGIYFPGLHIFFEKVISYIRIFKFDITIYAIVITLGFVLALFVAMKEAKRTGQNDEDYLDFFLVLIIPAIVGARLYYILFNLGRFIEPGKSFGATILDMINVRNGGLAVYGGLIAGVTAGAIFAKKKKLYFPLFGDTITMGVLVGQILGRWGNFFNREAFGAFTDGPLRMAIPVEYYSDRFLSHLTSEGIITSEMWANLETVKGVPCFTVHPTFLYEGLWNTALLIGLFLYRKHKKFDGEMSMIYIAGYGLGRFWVEALRTDSLMIGPLKVSQVVAILCVIVAVGVIIKNRLDIKRGKEPKINYVPAKEDDEDEETEDEDDIEEDSVEDEESTEIDEDLEENEEIEKEIEEIEEKDKKVDESGEED